MAADTANSKNDLADVVRIDTIALSYLGSQRPREVNLKRLQ
jgi:DNA-binding Xre family transcriptional regulator